MYINQWRRSKTCKRMTSNNMALLIIFHEKIGKLYRKSNPGPISRLPGRKEVQGSTPDLG